MNTSLIARIAAFSASFAVTLAILAGVGSMATTDTAPAWIAKAPIAKKAA